MKDVENATTYTFDNLEGSTEYSLTVQAVYNGEKTKPSAELVVATSNDESSIGSIHYAETIGSKVYDISGREVIDDNAKGVYIKKVNGRMVKVAR